MKKNFFKTPETWTNGKSVYILGWDDLNSNYFISPKLIFIQVNI